MEARGQVPESAIRNRDFKLLCAFQPLQPSLLEYNYSFYLLRLPTDPFC